MEILLSMIHTYTYLFDWSVELVVNIIQILKKRSFIFFNNKKILYNSMLIFVLTISVLQVKNDSGDVLLRWDRTGFNETKFHRNYARPWKSDTISFAERNSCSLQDTFTSPPLLDNSLLWIFPQINIHISTHQWVFSMIHLCRINSNFYIIVYNCKI